jgi:hypothetical protein
MVELEGMRDVLRTVDRYQVCCTKYRVNMNNSKVLGTILMKTWTDHPHASVFINTVTNLVKPLDESAQIPFPVVDEREEAYDSRNFKSLHALSIQIGVNEHTVITRVLVPPEWTCMDMFPSHATDATWITGSKESSRSRIEDLEFAFIPRVATSWYIFRITVITLVALREHKISNEVSQIWNSNFICQCCHCFCLVWFCMIQWLALGLDSFANAATVFAWFGSV